MAENRINRLRQCYHSMVEQQKIFNQWPHSNIDHYPVDFLKKEIDEFRSEFKDIIPELNLVDFQSQHANTDHPYYNCPGIKSYLGAVIGRLKIIIDNPQDTPITEKREFNFLNDPDLKKIIERDYSEIQRAFISSCSKSVIILCGGVIEAILTDLLLANVNQAISSGKAPRQTDITKWGLSDLIEVSVDLNLVSSSIEKLSHSIREYRNLVHPGKELRDKLNFNTEEARIALEVLHILHRKSNGVRSQHLTIS